MNVADALTWAADRNSGVLITLRADGRAQSSDVTYLVEDGGFTISMTDGRAKTRNMRRDDRVVLHVTAPDQWSYVSFDGTATLSAVTTSLDDETADRLVAYYEDVAGKPHPDWDEYRRAMIDEGRLIARVVPNSAVGQIR